MRHLYCDTETFSEVPIAHGAHAYAEKAEVMLFTYAIDDGPVRCIDLTDWGHHDGLTQDEEYYTLKQMLNDPDTMTVWHNSGFDRTVIRHALGIDLPIERVHDTMVQALCHGLPGGLDMLCQIFKLGEDTAKLKTGKALIQFFCKPNKGKRNTQLTHPEKWAEFVEYAKQDILAMRELRKKIPMWNYTGRERKLWELDQRINDRGFQVDTDLAREALAATDREQLRLAANTKTATGGEVGRATQRAKLLEHIETAYGVQLPDLTGDTIERYLDRAEIPQGLRDLLILRQQASTTSTAKYGTLLNAISSDGRLRGSLQFAGANRTARWAGRIFQPQNLMRPELRLAEIIEAIKDIKAGVVDLVYDNVMRVLSSCIRAAICAAPGKKLVVSDLSNIEGRMAAWLAGEEWKLDAFRLYDTFQLDENGEKIPDPENDGDFLRVGPDLYRLAYAKAFNVLVQQVDGGKSKGPHRQIGKVMELMLQYEGGVGAFRTGAETYGIDLDAMAEGIYDLIPTRIRSEARSFWGYASIKHQTHGLAERTFVVCDSLKRMWREAHPQIPSYWKELENAAIRAINNPGKPFKCRKLVLRKDGAWLRIILPSGRCLCYAGAKVIDEKISYLGINQYSRKWGPLGTYGGKLFENVTQAASRDVMGHNMPEVDEAGFLIVLSVHDELLTETPDSEAFNAEHLSELLSVPPPWALDAPLAAGGYEALNYRKD